MQTQHELPQDAFHKACEEGNLAECQQLYSDNPDYLNQLHSKCQSTGLQWAVQAGHKEVVVWLLAQNPELFVNHICPATAFAYCSNGEIFSYLQTAMDKKHTDYSELQNVKYLPKLLSLLQQGEATLDSAKTQLVKLLEDNNELVHGDENYAEILNQLGLVL